MNSVNEKKVAALAAVKYVKSGMSVGLGTGSTAFFMIEAIGEMVKNGAVIKAVATSNETEKLATKIGIDVITLAEAKRLDVTIDGADEVDDDFQLIKGGGGALLREKIVAHNSDMNIIIADSSKSVSKLGKFKLPIETIPFATKLIKIELEEMGLSPVQRLKGDADYKTDENNDIVDVDIWNTTVKLTDLEQKLKTIPGIVETGLFLTTTNLVIIGKGEQAIEKRR
ncbi:ribose-5-phosphate isomerase RpiA [Maribacter hydrothermalis]|uniref:Ribose-5-phosphate isomerase A n=1 Tax=Maribacter hydrothermalis TaxID=1836467 RepID=A0A1B7YZ86_9FLAO|nr:ribose-5-phosphate isomerase RpiA [Maribacter hydrothermalis]APQ16044.1 ribose 5-phosphate isomerase A [Maribacter hydrothermalis]OBR35778.1 ribose 5-phosphate isomerase A [Maribacter hydrothermalis]